MQEDLTSAYNEESVPQDEVIQEEYVEESAGEKNTGYEEVEEQVEESPQDRNWREMREMLKSLKQQNQELSSKLTEQEKRQQQEAYQYYQMQQWQQAHQGQQSDPTSEIDELGLDDTDVITVADAKKLTSRSVQQEVEKYLKKQELENIPKKLSTQYPDYNQIVNQDNVQKLIKDDPETAEDIESLKSDPLRMSRLLYKTLKARYGTNHEEEPISMAKKKEPQEKPQRPPASSSAVPKRSALAEANAFSQGLTPELKAQLLKEMDEAAKYH